MFTYAYAAREEEEEALSIGADGRLTDAAREAPAQILAGLSQQTKLVVGGVSTSLHTAVLTIKLYIHTYAQNMQFALFLPTRGCSE